MNPGVMLALLSFALPLLALVPFITPPEWWFSLKDDSSVAKSANIILWYQMRHEWKDTP